MIMGENGIFSKSNTAKEKTNYTSAKEILDLKLLDIEVECKTENKEYTIEEIEEKLSSENEKEVLIVAYYHDKLAAIKNDVTRNITNLKGIAVKIDRYDKYTFLIGEMGEIEGVTTAEVEEDTPITVFDLIDTFEKEKLGIITNSNSSSNQTQNNNYIYNRGTISNEAEDILLYSDVNAESSKNEDSLYATITTGSNNPTIMETKNKINLTNYTKIRCVVSTGNTMNPDSRFYLMLCPEQINISTLGSSTQYKSNAVSPNQTEYVLEYDIPEKCRNNQYYVCITSSYQDVYVYSIELINDENRRNYIYNRGVISNEAEDIILSSNTKAESSKNIDNLYANATDSTYNDTTMLTENKIDLTNYTKIKCYVSTGNTLNSQSAFKLILRSQQMNYQGNVAVYKSNSPGPNQELYTLEYIIPDDCKNDEFYVGIETSLQNVYVYKIWAE